MWIGSIMLFAHRASASHLVSPASVPCDRPSFFLCVCCICFLPAPFSLQLHLLLPTMLLCHLPACSGACCNILLSSGIRFSQAHSLLTGQGAATFAVGCIGTDLVPFVGLSSSFVLSVFLLGHCLLSAQGDAIFAVGCSCPDLLPFVWISSSSFVVICPVSFSPCYKFPSFFFFFFCLEFVCFDAIIADLQSQLQSLDASLSNASDKLTLADQEKDPGRHKKLETPKVVTPRAVTKGTKGQVHTNSSNIGDLFSEGSLNPYADDPYAFD
nr:uncharacterized protein LOC113719002 isoform X2 [Coffea arabica]XP_027106207.1 uncharacterized protein LOC113726598 isoform X2 [Coffea arabica]